MFASAKRFAHLVRVLSVSGVPAVARARACALRRRALRRSSAGVGRAARAPLDADGHAAARRVPLSLPTRPRRPRPLARPRKHKRPRPSTARRLRAPSSRPLLPRAQASATARVASMHTQHAALARSDNHPTAASKS
eukprot:6198223-Pleurochrysis_carterae.AAC.2